MNNSSRASQLALGICAAALILPVAACKPTAAQKPQSIAQVKTGNVSAPDTVQGEIHVVYPPPGTIVPAASSFIVGSITPGRTLQCNGSAVKVSAKGYYAHVVSLQRGSNKFHLTEPETGESRDVVVEREHAHASIAPGTFKLAIETAQPQEDLGVTAGDIINLSVRATPDSDVRVQIGKRVVQLRPATAIRQAAAQSRHKSRSRGATGNGMPANVNVGLDAAYGKIFQRWPESGPDLYLGFYKVMPDDAWPGLTPRFILNHGGKSATLSPSARISVVRQPMLAQTKHDDVVVRVGPGLGRITPLPEGVRLLIDGWKGDQFRCQYSSNYHVWIKRDDLVMESQGDSGPAPHSVIRTINVGTDPYGAVISIPLNQRLPFQIEQHLKPNRLTMRIYGAEADTDWVAPMVPDPQERELVDHVDWKQSSDGVYEVSVALNEPRQWGFYADYQGANLLLHVKRAPNLTPSEGEPLKGLKICLDPGHGGPETGAIGCGGMPESRLNLGIALKLQDLLKKAGADVIMTRDRDVEVSLEDRVSLAERNHVDILLSIHNNALPDGRDPWVERGTSSYWYHQQAIELARSLKASVERSIGFPDLATRWQNLALTRPSPMLATLYEVGFMVNPDEYTVLESEQGQEKAARGLLNGLVQYFHTAQTGNEQANRD